VLAQPTQAVAVAVVVVLAQTKMAVLAALA
jgi:hypothetical protein